jgi:hypothetical protein
VDAVAAVEAALMITGVTEDAPDTREYSFFPNPVAGMLTIEHSTKTSVQKLRIFSTEGKVIKTLWNIALPGTIDVSSLATGLYIFQADDATPALISVVR